MTIEGESITNTTSAIVTGTKDELNRLGFAVMREGPAIPDWLTITLESSVEFEQEVVKFRITFEWVDECDRASKIHRIHKVLKYHFTDERSCNVYR